MIRFIFLLAFLKADYENLLNAWQLPCRHCHDKMHAAILQILQERSNTSRNILLGANICKSTIVKHQKRWVSMWNEIHQNSPGRSSANSCWYKFLLPKVMALILHHLAARRVFGPKHLHAQFSRLVDSKFRYSYFFLLKASPRLKKKHLQSAAFPTCVTTASKKSSSAILKVAKAQLVFARFWPRFVGEVPVLVEVAHVQRKMDPFLGLPHHSSLSLPFGILWLAWGFQNQVTKSHW